ACPPTPRPPSPTLFPYTTLFRSRAEQHEIGAEVGEVEAWVPHTHLVEVQHRQPPSEDHVAIVVVLVNGDVDGQRDLTCPMLQARSEEHTSELQSLAYLVCRLLLE